MIAAIIALILSASAVEDTVSSLVRLEGAHGGSAALPSYPIIGGSPGDPCTVELSVRTDGSHRVEELSCEGANEVTLRAAITSWTFSSIQLAQGRDHVTLDLEFRPLTDSRGTTQLRLFDHNLEGTPGGVIGGGLQIDDQGPPAVHYPEVKVRKRVAPKMPEEAKVQGIEEARCMIRFFIDEKGKPYDVKTEECPEIYVPSALEAGWQWRFEPMLVDGVPIKAQFILVIVYRLK